MHSLGQNPQEGTPVERRVARICREAGARVRFNAFLRDMNINVGAADERRIEVLAQDLPSFGGAQLAVDVTLRSVLSATGEPHPHTAEVDGVVLLRARQDKERTYPELIGTGRCMLVVVAIETGGRWSDESVGFIRQLAFAKAREVPKYLRWPTILAWERDGPGCSQRRAASPSLLPWWNRSHSAARGAGTTVKHLS